MAGLDNGPQYADDVFSSYVYTGTGSALTLTDNIDRTAGALDIFKGRSGATDWAWYDTTRGVQKDLVSNSTAAETTQAQGVTATSGTGVTIGTLAKINTSAATYVKYTFKESARFFKKVTVSHTNGVADNVDLNSLSAVGMVAVKRTDNTSDWLVWHRSQTSGKLTYLNQANAETTDASLSVSGTTLTLAAALATGTYVVYAWAHVTLTDDVIQCGTFTTDGSGNATVSLGWEPQSIIYKLIDGAGGGWFMRDIIRGWTINTGGSESKNLLTNTSNAETTSGLLSPTATGLSAAGLISSSKYIYLVVRRGNKPPTSGAQVYNAIARTGSGSAATLTGVGFPPDVMLTFRRDGGYGDAPWMIDRLRGISGTNALRLVTGQPGGQALVSSTVLGFDAMDGIRMGVNDMVNGAGSATIHHFFRRAAEFLAEVFDTGTGSAHTIAHDLGVVPELMIRKSLTNTLQWEVWHSALANTEKLVLNSNAAKATDTTAWNSTTPGASSFTVGTGANVNTNTEPYVTLLFASKAGISKIGSYTGNGSSLTINCGFAAGARFVLIKRIDLAGDWFLWDTARGIVAGNDPYIRLNSASAEVTTNDSIDPDSSGFIVNQVAATNINVVGATYAYLAIA